MGNDHLHLEFAPGWLLEDANALSCGACPQHRLVQVNMGPSSMRFTFEAFQAFSTLMKRMSDQITSTEPATIAGFESAPEDRASLGMSPGGGKVISGIFPQREH